MMLLLIFPIGSPAVSNATHLFPFLIRRYRANIDKRICNLHISIRELHYDFSLALEEYEPGGDVTAGFPSADLLLGEYRDAVPPFAIAWGHLAEDIIDMTG